jgi:hypothetical protein
MVTVLALASLATAEELQDLPDKKQEKRGIATSYSTSEHGSGLETYGQTVEISKPVAVPVVIRVPHPVPVAIAQPVAVPVPHPVPVHIQVPVHVPVIKTVAVPVDRPIPVPVEKPVPYPVHVPVYKHIHHYPKIHYRHGWQH